MGALVTWSLFERDTGMPRITHSLPAPIAIAMLAIGVLVVALVWHRRGRRSA